MKSIGKKIELWKNKSTVRIRWYNGIAQFSRWDTKKTHAGLLTQEFTLYAFPVSQ